MGHFIEWLVLTLARLFPRRYRIIPRKEDGVPMLRQFKITSWCYIQSFLYPETEEIWHRHRWQNMRSFVLSGSFIEERFGLYGAPRFEFKRKDIWRKLITHKALSTYKLNDHDIHRLHQVSPKTWTIFFMFGRHQNWGYYHFGDNGNLCYTPWYQAIPSRWRVKSL